MFVSFQWFWVQSFGFLSPEAVKFQPRGATLWALRSHWHNYTVNKHCRFPLDWKANNLFKTTAATKKTIESRRTTSEETWKRPSGLCVILRWAKGRDVIFQCACIWNSVQTFGSFLMARNSLADASWKRRSTSICISQALDGNFFFPSNYFSHVIKTENRDVFQLHENNCVHCSSYIFFSTLDWSTELISHC